MARSLDFIVEHQERLSFEQDDSLGFYFRNYLDLLVQSVVVSTMWQEPTFESHHFGAGGGFSTSAVWIKTGQM